MTKQILLSSDVTEQFNVDPQAVLIESGEGRTYRSGDVILKHINNDSSDQTKWIAELFHNIKEINFRVPRPIKSQSGDWITDEGWSAWTFLEGSHEYQSHIPQIVEAIVKFHDSIKHVHRPAFFDEDSEYRRADRYAWGDKPSFIHPQVKPLVEELYTLRRPVTGLDSQVIHGDLGPANILLSEGKSPGIIDIAPYWRPVEFALAVFAYWIGPYKGDMEVLKYFPQIKEFDQMLIRAGIRMLLIKSEFNIQGNDLDMYKMASDLITDYIKQR